MRDLDFSSSPTRVTVRAETTKTKQARTVYISNEATKELKKFLHKKYGRDHLVFSVYNHEVKPIYIYGTLSRHFIRVLNKVDLARRKEGIGLQRREINFHSMRSFVKTVIAEQTNTDFSEYFLGHSYSTYWVMKEPDRKKLYLKCMPYLTFLEFGTVESIGRDYLSKLEERDKEILELKHALGKVYGEIDELKQSPNR